MRRFCKKSGVGSSQSGLSIIWLSRSFPISLWCPCRQSRKLKMDKLTHLTRFWGLCVFWGNWICCRSWLKRKNSAQMSTMQWSIRWRNISANAPGAVRKKCGGSGMVDVGKSCSVRTIAQALASLFSARRLSAFLRRWEVSCRWIKKESSDCSAVIEGSLSVATTYSPLFKIPLPSPPFVGEVVLRGTLSHKPALRCAAHGADAPFAVDEYYVVDRALLSMNTKEPRLIFINRGSRSVATTYSSTW